MKTLLTTMTLLLTTASFAEPAKRAVTRKEEELVKKEQQLDKREHELAKRELESQKSKDHGALFHPGKFGVLGYMGASAPGVVVGYVPMPHLAVAGGFGLSVPASGGVDSNIVLVASYFFYDKFPFAIGPEVFYEGRISSSTGASPFSHHIIEAGIAFWYAPFSAPIGIGSVVHARVEIESGQNTTFSIATPTVRVFYIFN